MERTSQSLRGDARKCRDLAGTAITPAARDILSNLAEEYERQAAETEYSEQRRKSRPAFQWTTAAATV